MRNVSLCIPYYNRADLVMETLKYPLTDKRISEIIICDDYSPEDDYLKLLKNISGLSKIKVYKNVENLHVQHNKRNSISFASNDWVIVLDNDNVIDKNFVDKLFEIEDWNEDTIYHPDFASPNFSYKQFDGHIISKENVRNYVNENIFVTLLNTNNYMVNKHEYLKVYKYDKNVRGADGIFFSYNWLKAGNKINIVKDLSYFHRVHPGSEFLREKDNNMLLIYNWLSEVSKL